MHENISSFLKFIAGDQLEVGVRVEKEHSKVYDLLESFLKKNNLKMPLSRKEFFEMIAKAHLNEDKNYYDKLLKYVEKSAKYELTPSDEKFIEKGQIRKDLNVEEDIKKMIPKHTISYATLNYDKYFVIQELINFDIGKKVYIEIYREEKGVSLDKDGYRIRIDSNPRHSGAHEGILVSKEELKTFLNAVKKGDSEAFEVLLNLGKEKGTFWFSKVIEKVKV